VSCLFCRIVAKEITASIVYEDDQILAFNDVNPQAPVHILVIPKQHVGSIADEAAAKLTARLFSVMRTIAQEKGIEQSGYRIVVNHGKDSGQAVPHLHFHLLGGRPLLWPPG
jgi:histidine triad (HIT) family protein